MCRFALYLGHPIMMDTLVTLPTNSIIHQSYKSKEREEPLNGDGFGVAWYVPSLVRKPAVFRSVSPAWSNQNLYHIARVTQSPCILAHVRAASPGLPVIETNCHPFVIGDFAFMHNGYIPEFRRLKRRILREISDDIYESIQGSTDSEHIFALFQEHLKKQTHQDITDAMIAAMRLTIQSILQILDEGKIEEPTQLNLAVTNGESAVVTRFSTGPSEKTNSLYVHMGKRFVCEDGICRMVEPKKFGDAVLIASEKLSEGDDWERVPHNHMVMVSLDDDEATMLPCLVDESV